MRKVVRVFRSHDEADRADQEYYASLTPKQRVDIVLDLVASQQESPGEAAEGFKRVCRVIRLEES